MAIDISIPLDKLQDPPVAHALANLVEALGQIGKPARKRRAEATVAKAEEAAPAAEKAAPKRRGGGRKAAAAARKQAAKPKAKAKRTPTAKAKPKAKAKAKAKRGRPKGGRKTKKQQRYEEFAAGLPDRSRNFLMALEKRGQLNMGDAMKAIGVDTPKSLGGITGSINRWAKARGVDVPFKTGTDRGGDRQWTWTG